MIQSIEAETLSSLYEADETAWLDAMTDLIRRNAYGELDYVHLQEYLADMALRERREVESRLTTLLAHILKWEHQSDRRSNSWRATIIEQRQQLARHAKRGVLRNHADATLPDAYADAVELAAAETGLKTDAFPSVCPYTLDEVLAFDPA